MDANGASRRLPSNPANRQTKSGKSTMGAPRGPVLPTLIRLLGYLRPYKVKIALVVLCMLASAALSLTPPWLTKVAVDKAILGRDLRLLWLLAASVVGIAVLQGGVDFFVRYLAESTGQKALFDIRQDVYSHLTGLSFSYFDRARTGDIMSRITSDGDAVQRFLGFSCVNIIGNSLILVGIAVVMLLWDVRLALLYLAFLPFMVYGMSGYAFRVRPAFRKVRQVLAEMTQSIRENLAGIQVVKLFCAEQQALQSFSGSNERFYETNVGASRISSLWMPYVMVLMGVGSGFVVWFAGRQIVAGRMTLGTLIGFTSYISLLMRPVRQTGMLLGESLVSVAAAERIFDVLDTEPEVKDLPGASVMPPIEGAVTYDRVCFSYDKQMQVLHDISFSVKPGETVALVGPTGAGKTTIVHLLPRFYDPDSGKIFIDGHDISGVTVKSLRKQIGIVLQETFLFDRSIRENIAFGKRRATLSEVKAAARAAEIDEFIESLPQGYDTLVGQRGAILSGGQRQRIAIARMLLTDPRIVILDESTSSLDVQTEEKLQLAMKALFKGRTVFVIAHRLWTTMNADRILVVEGGRIVQNGSHSELVGVPGPYRDIYHLQLAQAHKEDTSIRHEQPTRR